MLNIFILSYGKNKLFKELFNYFTNIMTINNIFTYKTKYLNY